MPPLSLKEPVNECAAVSLSYETAICDLKCPCPEERLIPSLLITLYPRLKSRGMTERPGLKVQLSQPNRCDRGSYSGLCIDWKERAETAFPRSSLLGHILATTP
ncbi:hypothetical protein DPX16_19278 [Anabarilius grahami]|uniref:Uncharacterized protein n=1 Tax=Anabarilius grahami TaxID=495550 RepID=A0A3N0YZN5_ANAGA|nr:hypothetical protein DPX16_19278 [Anabarilius grahami]